MFRFLKHTFILVAVLATSSLAWGELFKGPDWSVHHRPEPVRIPFPISGTPTSLQVFPQQCIDNISFPANFRGLFPDAAASATCTVAPVESDTYAIRVAGSQIGTMTIPSGGAAPTYIQQTNATAVATTVTTPSITTTAGNALVVAVGLGTATFAPAITNTGTPVSWTACPPAPVLSVAAQEEVQEFYATNIPGGAVTVTSTIGGTDSQTIELAEFHNIAPSSAQDTCGAGAVTSAASTTVTTANVVTSNALDVIVGAGMVVGNITVVSGPTGGFTSLVSGGVTGSTGAQLLPAYQLTNAIGTYGATWVISSAQVSLGAILALKGINSGPCMPVFATTNGLPQYCKAGQRLELDAPATVSGSNIAVTLGGHVP